MFIKNLQDHLFKPDWKLQEGSGLRDAAQKLKVNVKA